MFIINFFISFLLLELTSRLIKKEAILWRILLSSAIGGAYSLIILLDEMPSWILLSSKLLVSAVMVFIAFKFYRLVQYIKAVLIFFFSSLIFLGVIIAICFAFKTDAIAVNNSVVYFNISAVALIASSAAAYFISCVVIRIYNRTLSKREIYTLVITNQGKTVTLLAFLDTGNRLREPFSDAPVIIAKKSKLNSIIGTSEIRIIPTDTVSDSALLVAFKPEKIVLKSTKSSEILDNVYVALSDNILSNQYSAILNPDILSI